MNTLTPALSRREREFFSNLLELDGSGAAHHYLPDRCNALRSSITSRLWVSDRT